MRLSKKKIIALAKRGYSPVYSEPKKREPSLTLQHPYIIHHGEPQKNGDIYLFDIDPLKKPRMTVGDRANYRPVTKKYWAFKEELERQAKKIGFTVPEGKFHLIFYIPMPSSWSEKKKEKMNCMPHQQTPDKDNLEKAFLDCLCKNDSYVYDSRVSKYWAKTGRITVTINSYE